MFKFILIVAIFCLLRFIKVGRIKEIFVANPQTKNWLVVSVIVLALVIFVGTETITSTVFTTMDKVTESIGHITNPPPPEKVWKGSTIIEAPVESDWAKVPEITALHYGIVEWNMTNLAPHEKGRYEIMADGWPKPFIGGDGSKECQGLPDSLRFKIRSLEAYPIKLRLEWR